MNKVILSFVAFMACLCASGVNIYTNSFVRDGVTYVQRGGLTVKDYVVTNITSSGSGGAVDSVNGKTGTVQLTAIDVGALSISGGTISNNVPSIKASILIKGAQPEEPDIFSGDVTISGGDTCNGGEITIGGGYFGGGKLNIYGGDSSNSEDFGINISPNWGSEGRGYIIVNGTNVMDAISGAGKVKSVNGETGDVVISEVNSATNWINKPWWIEDSWAALANEANYSTEAGHVPWNGIEDKPSWIGNTKPTYTASEVGAPSTNSFNELTHRVELIELTSHPNMTIVGNPTFTEGNVSGFTANDYLVFPTEVSVGTNRVEFYMSFHTGGNVTTQQNLMDSAYGLAFAIRNGTTVTAISTDGQSFIGENAGGTLSANHSYRLKLEFTHENGVYSIKTYLADGGGEYTQVGNGLTASAPLYPTATYWGGANPGHTAHIFGGSINLSQCWMDFNGKTVWRGYDELPKVSYDPTAEEPLDTAEKILKSSKEVLTNASVDELIGDGAEPQSVVGRLTDGSITISVSEGRFILEDSNIILWECSPSEIISCYTNRMYRLTEDSFASNAITFTNLTGVSVLTINAPVEVDGKANDFVVYASVPENEQCGLSLEGFGRVFAKDATVTDSLEPGLTVLYFTQFRAGGYYTISRQTFKADVTQ